MQPAYLFIEFTRTSPVSDEECIDIIGGGPWSTPAHPMALVLTDVSTYANPVALSANIPYALSASLETFGRRLKATIKDCESQPLQNTTSCTNAVMAVYSGRKTEEILYTDGKVIAYTETGNALHRTDLFLTLIFH
jgi:hypothetical protein